MSKRIGFVGVGKMGANMARHLKLDNGYDVPAVYDINREAASSLATELGGVAYEKLADVTANSDVIITVVTNDAAMRAIYQNEGDNLLQNAAGKTFIDCATLSPAIHREVGAACTAAGAPNLEACMASSIGHARSGELYLMVAGDQSAFDDNKQLLDDLSLKLRFITGGRGRAAEVKALVNMVMNINTAGLAEGLGLAAALGHEIDLIREIFSQTGANSRVLETDAEDMRDRAHEAWFSAEHAAKDSGIAAGLAAIKGLNLPLNTATLSQYTRMTNEGLGDLDKSGVAELTFPGRHAHPAAGGEVSTSQNQTQTNTQTKLMSQIPLISSGSAGPLGVLHLPRFWQKVSLDAVGKLNPDYPACGGGFDQMTLDALKLDKDKTLAYIKDNKPSYKQFEEWVSANGDLSGKDAHNLSVVGYCHGDDVRAGINGATGYDDHSCGFRDAVHLNNLEDWAEWHKAEIAG